MTDSLPSVVLTDDELCALAWFGRAAVPMQLQTVDVMSVEHFTDAAIRGMKAMASGSQRLSQMPDGCLSAAADPFRSEVILTVRPIWNQVDPAHGLPRLSILRQSGGGGDVVTAWTTIGGGIHRLERLGFQEALHRVASVVTSRKDGSLLLTVMGGDGELQAICGPVGALWVTDLSQPGEGRLAVAGEESINVWIETIQQTLTGNSL